MADDESVTLHAELGVCIEFVGQFVHGYAVGRVKFDLESDWLACNFFRFHSFSLETITKLKQIKKTSVRITSPALLSPVVFAKEERSLRKSNKTFENTIVGYIFDNSLSQWLANNSGLHLFDADNGIMHEWWSSNLSRLYRTITEMHRLGICHGNLDKISSYVIVADSICLVNPTIINGDDQSKKSDLVHFADFLESLERGKNSLDWNDFISALRHGRTRELENHPVFEDSKARFDNLRGLTTRTRSAWNINIDKWEHFKKEELYNQSFSHGFNNWYTCLTIDEYKTFYNEPWDGKPYDPNSVFSLIKFVEHVMKHTPTDVKTTDQIERDLEKMFPGLLSHLNNCYASYRRG